LKKHWWNDQRTRGCTGSAGNGSCLPVNPDVILYFKRKSSPLNAGRSSLFVGGNRKEVFESYFRSLQTA
jgi:hypothetical protein